MSNKAEKSNVDHINDKPISIEKLKIGYVMPIAKTDGYPESHWNDVMSILDSTITKMGIKKGRIVSDGGEITTIHSRIVNNLNDDDIIICDVSSRNPNVMFELGMRIAFDKPVIIIKDDFTDYCFDSGTIEHLGYPKDLRHGVINTFQIKLTEKINATFDAYIKNNPVNISPILKNFGSFDKRDIELNELSANEILIQDIQVIKNTLVRLQMNSSNSSTPLSQDGKRDISIITFSGNNARVDINRLSIRNTKVIFDWIAKKDIEHMVDNDKILNILVNSNSIRDELMNLVLKM